MQISPIHNLECRLVRLQGATLVLRSKLIAERFIKPTFFDVNGIPMIPSVDHQVIEIGEVFNEGDSFLWNECD